MRKSRFTEEQIIGAPKEHATGFSAAELCHKYGVSDATFYKWRSKFGGMEISDEDENRKLKKLLAESMLDAATLKEMLGKKLLRPGLAPKVRGEIQLTDHHSALMIKFYSMDAQNCLSSIQLYSITIGGHATRAPNITTRLCILLVPCQGLRT